MALILVKRWPLWLIVVFMLAACSQKPAPASTGTPASGALARPTAEVALTATATAIPRPTHTPIRTATHPPTLTPTVWPSATPTAQPTAQVTAAPSALVLPAVALAAARGHQLIGDCTTARRELAELLAGPLSPADASEARYRMAQCYMRDRALAEALVTLQELLASAPSSDTYRAPATFNLAETLSALEEWRAAEAAYTAYLPLAPELDYLTWQRIGAARRALDDLPGAVAAYQTALAVSPDWTNTVAIRRALADLALQQNRSQEAVAQYDALRGKETTGAWAAEMQYLAGAALAKGLTASLLAGSTPMPDPTPAAAPPALAEAQRRWQAAVDADVTSAYAHAAIVALLDSGATVDEYQREVANYHKGNYALAIAAFERLRAVDPTGRNGDAWYYAGLSYLALGDTLRGFAEIDHFVAAFPHNLHWADAWLAKGRAQARADDDAGAISTYRRLAAARPDTPQASKALWQAALLEGQPGPNPNAAAGEAYLALARRYPKADEGWRAYQAAGLTFLQLNDPQRASAVWREMAQNGDLATWTRPVAYFWLGQAQLAADDRAAALISWQAAQQAGPESFYGLRAADWASGNDAERLRGGVGALGGAAAQQPTSQPASRKASDDAVEIAAWLQTWAGAGSLDLPAAVRADADWRRGQTLLALGLRTQALANWGRMQPRYRDNPWTTAALALALHEAGAHRLSLLSAEALVERWGGAMRAAPAPLQRLAYPFPYADLIRVEAARQGVDPRLMAAIIRQESRFETGAASSAGAQGLMQVMPGTAQSIAEQLQWPDFRPEQAYWPYVNVAFGSFYIHQWLTHFGGSIFVALAAYNGGPGNATAWRTWAPEDDELMAALININETRVYIQAVWTNYEAYQRLYSR